MQSQMDEWISFQTHPSRYRHWKLEVEGDRATLTMQVQENEGLRPGYVLKLNSYDLGVDIELADAIQRLRFEHPEVKVCVITGAMERIFCAGANIMMLASSPHGFKVNFCKFTNETRLALEDASASSGIRFLAALQGTASGGGYELALACDEILLVDDRSSAVSFPEVPLLGVLPGTGGLTRLVDKRKVRRDLADVFSTMAEGVKGRRALEWRLVDEIAPLSTFFEKVDEMCGRMAASAGDKSGRTGVELPPIEPDIDGGEIRYRHVRLALDGDLPHVAEMWLTVPDDATSFENAEQARAMGSDWWLFRMFRELDDAVLRLRFNHPEVSVVAVRCVGSIEHVIAADEALTRDADDWYVNEVRHFIKRVLKRLDVTAKTIFALADDGCAFAGSLLEVALAADRLYALDDPTVDVRMATTAMNGGAYPMANGLTRLETRFLGTPAAVQAALDEPEPFAAERASALGIATVTPDDIDWEDEIRVALEERASFSPDALTGMEANLRFAGPETMETKIFGRLSAWQNWIFQRPNAVGERGALKCYGTPLRPELEFLRT